MRALQTNRAAEGSPDVVLSSDGVLFKVPTRE